MHLPQCFGLTLTIFMALTSAVPAQVPKNNFTVRCLNKDSILVQEEIGKLNLELELTDVMDKENQLKPGDFRLAILDAKLQQLDEIVIAIPEDYQRRTFKKGENKSTLTLTFPGPGDLRPHGKDFFAAIIITPAGGENVFPALVRLVKFKLGDMKDKPAEKAPKLDQVCVDSPQEIERFVKQLSSNDFTDRDAAQKEAVPNLKKLGQARVEAARKGYDLAIRALQAGQAGVRAEDAGAWSVRLLNAQCDRSSKQADRIIAFDDHLQRMQALAQKVEQMRNAALGTPLDSPAADYYLREAELWVAREKAANK